MHKFKYVSLFSGVGGFETALNRLGGKCVLASEIDKYANKSYEVLYGHPTDGDVTAIDAENVPDHDVLAAGFPCQAFSVAGKRLGFEDTRGTLFFEVARIAKVKRPRFIILENVKGLLSHDKGRTLDVIVQTLNEIGYAVDFAVLNSKYFGVPQNRERIILLADRDAAHASWTIPKKLDVVGKAKKRIAALEGIRTFNFPWPTNSDVSTRLVDVLEGVVPEKYYLSEEKTAKLIAELQRQQDTTECVLVGKLALPGKDQWNRVYDPVGVSPTLVTMQGGRQEPKIVVECTQFSQDGDGISYALDANYAKGTAPGDVGKARRTHVLEEVRACLTPDRVERRQVGRRFKEDGEPSFTLTAQDIHGDAVKSPTWRIRKLTPLECFRLQGFPDDYHAKLSQAGISDSQLYKQAGNAVTVNVIEAVGERILKWIEVTTTDYANAA